MDFVQWIDHTDRPMRIATRRAARGRAIEWSSRGTIRGLEGYYRYSRGYYTRTRGRLTRRAARGRSTDGPSTDVVLRAIGGSIDINGGRVHTVRLDSRRAEAAQAAECALAPPCRHPRTHAHTHVRTRTRKRTHTRTRRHMHVHERTCTHTHAHAHAHAEARTNTHARTHARTHTRKHAHARTRGDAAALNALRYSGRWQHTHRHASVRSA
jgi:hypothetical protein